MNELTPCPLCSNIDTRHFHQDTQREYLICPSCDLVFVDPKYYLDRDAEFKRYELQKMHLTTLAIAPFSNSCVARSWSV